jgi:hypothetical protein
MKQIPLTISVLLTLTSGTMIYAQDANSEQEQFDARIEQFFSESYDGQYTVEKNGNLIRLTDTYAPQTTLGYHSDLAVAPLRAKFVALCILAMDSEEKELNPAHKLAAFIN